MIAINALRDTFIYAFKYPFILLAPLVPGLLTLISTFIFDRAFIDVYWVNSIVSGTFSLLSVAAAAWAWGVIIIAFADIEIYGRIKPMSVLTESLSWILALTFTSILMVIVIFAIGILPGYIVFTTAQVFGWSHSLLDSISNLQLPFDISAGLIIMALLILWIFFVILAVSLAPPSRVVQAENASDAIGHSWRIAKKNILALTLCFIFIGIFLEVFRIVLYWIPIAGPILQYALPFFFVPAILTLFYMKATDVTGDEFGARLEYEMPPD